jgi:hypothetical protein
MTVAYAKLRNFSNVKAWMAMATYVELFGVLRNTNFILNLSQNDNIHLPCEITEPCQNYNSTLRVERDEVVWGRAEIVEVVHALIEYRGFGDHVYISE